MWYPVWLKQSEKGVLQETGPERPGVRVESVDSQLLDNPEKYYKASGYFYVQF
jgi:hypothetical protein